MADPQLDQLKKQIDDLNKRVAALGGEFFKDIDQAIASFGGGIKGAEAALKSLRKEMDGLDTDANYFYETLKKVTKELKGQTNYNNDIRSSYSKLSSIANRLKYDQDGISELSKKDLENIKKKVQIQQTDLTQFLKRNEEAEGASLAKQDRYIERLGKLEDKLEKKWELSQDEYALYDSLEKKLEKERAIYDKIVEANEEVRNLLNDEDVGIGKLLAATQRRLDEEIKIQNALGISGKIVDGIVGALGRLGISSTFFENLKDDMRDAAKSGDKWKVATTAVKGLVSGIGEALKDPVTQINILYNVLKFFVKSALTANEQIVQLGKSLGTSAENFRERLVGIESSSSNINVTTANLVEAFNDLTKATGLAYEFSADQLKTQILLTKQVGIQADEAAQIQRFGVLNKQTSEATYNSFVKGLVATRNQLKVGIDFKATLAEATKISGQLAANLGFNPERIAKAVVQAKALGLTFDQLKSATSSLLDFESSIENELKAELLTGGQMNLERARAAALAGDQVALAEELAKNIGTAADFTKMNVLQQDALAKSVGMTSDQLAETLRRREEAIASGKSLAQITEEEAKAAIERQTIQNQFNQSIIKLQSLIGNLLAGPLGTMLDVLVKILNVVNLILQPFTLLANFIKESTAASLTFLGTLGAIYAVKNKTFLIDKAQVAIEGVKKAYNATEIGQLGIIESIKSKGFFKTLADAAMTAFRAVAGVPFIGPILGAAAAATAVGLGMKLFSKGDDVVSQGYGKRVLSTPEGSIALNDKDTIVAGTDLGGGNQTITPTIDLSPMIAAINEVKVSVDNLMNRPVVITMDSKQVGSNLVQGSYKLA